MITHYFEESSMLASSLCRGLNTMRFGFTWVCRALQAPFYKKKVFPQFGPHSDLLGTSKGQERFERKHAIFRRDFKKEEFFDIIQSSVNGEQLKGRPLIISREGFSGVYRQRSDWNNIWGHYLADDKYVDDMRQTSIERLLDLFPHAKILLIVREPVERLTSHYCQSVGMSRQNSALLAQNIDGYLDGMCEMKTGYDTSAVYRDFLSAFGEDKVTLIPFEKLKITPKLFWQSICEWANVPVEQVKPELFAKVNHSNKSTRYLKLRLWENHFRNNLGDKQHNLAARVLLKSMSELAEKLAKGGEPCLPNHNGRIYNLARLDSQQLANESGLSLHEYGYY